MAWGCVHCVFARRCLQRKNAGMITLAIVLNVTCGLAFAMAFKSRLPAAAWWKQWLQALLSAGGACFAGFVVPFGGADDLLDKFEGGHINSEWRWS